MLSTISLRLLNLFFLLFVLFSLSLPPHCRHCRHIQIEAARFKYFHNWTKEKIGNSKSRRKNFDTSSHFFLLNISSSRIFVTHCVCRLASLTDLNKWIMNSRYFENFSIKFNSVFFSSFRSLLHQLNLETRHDIDWNIPTDSPIPRQMFNTKCNAPKIRWE